MKRIIIIGLCWTLLSFNTNPTKKIITNIKVENILLNEFKSHIDKTNGFKIDYPTNWNIEKKDSKVIFMAVENDVDTSDKFNESFNLTIMSSKGKTLDVIAEENIKAAKEYYGDIDIKNSKAVNNNGVSFIAIRFVQKVKGLTLVNFAVFFSKKGQLYTLSMIAETKKMKKYGPLYQNIINSFNWTSKN